MLIAWLAGCFGRGVENRDVTTPCFVIRIQIGKRTPVLALWKLSAEMTRESGRQTITTTTTIIITITEKTRHNKLVVFVFVLLHGPFKTAPIFYSLFQTIQRQAVRLSDVNVGVTQTPFDCQILVCFTCRGDIGNRFWRTKRCLLKLGSIRLYVTLITGYWCLPNQMCAFITMSLI